MAGCGGRRAPKALERLGDHRSIRCHRLPHPVAARVVFTTTRSWEARNGPIDQVPRYLPSMNEELSEGSTPPVAESRCTKGHTVPQQFQYCPHCGAPVHGGSSTAASLPAQGSRASALPPGTRSPGWYNDPTSDSRRWWDGERWSQNAPRKAPSPTAPTAASGNDSNTMSVIGIVCGAVAFLLLPVIFGPAGLIMGAIGLTRKERLAPVAMAVAASEFIAGMVIGAAMAGF